jgi:DNA-binding response OmpR family regulator
MKNTRVEHMPSRAGVLPRPFIVVVDDERRIADTLVLILNAKGYRAEAAHDGASALAKCRQKSPDLVLSDVVMPGMNGVELAIAIRQQCPRCPILLFSGQAETTEILEGARRRGYDFELLAKPVHPEELLARIRELIGPENARQQLGRR